MSIEKLISPYVASQLPRLYREEGPAFIAFVRAYYEWMESEGGLVNKEKSLPEYRDIDTTLEQYLVHFKNKYMIGLPENALGDKRTLQKHIKEIYSSKGTSQGLELLFRLLYNENSEVYLPGDDILRPSDGVWTQPVYLEVSVNPYNVLLIGEKITGRESRATAIVEDFQVRYINKRQINVLFLSNVRGDFKTNELILSNVIEDPLESATVIGSMSEILVNESGFGFKIGDVLEVGDGSGLLGKAVVSSVSPRNGAVSFTIQHGGSGFANNSQYAPNVINVTPVDLDNPGIGADFEIGELANTEVIVTAVDTITPYANTQLNSPDYQFPTNLGAENINTPLDQAFDVQNITVGTIRTLRAINPGAGYNGPVIVTVDSPVISGLMIQDPVNGNYKGNNAIVDGKAAAGNGAIDTVKILNSGIGYANGDIITLINANVPFVAGGIVLLKKQGIGEGFWKDTRSFLNSDKYIQDSFYYQEYSYETRLSVAFSYYSDLLKKLWHPAGTQGFGKVVITTEVDSESDAVEVDIIATHLTEYMTQFSTEVLTVGSTASMFVTQFATEYPTNKDTETSRTTAADYLANEPNLVLNGAFTFSTDGWSARGDSLLTWEDGMARIELASGDGSMVQEVATTDGHTYQIDLQFANSTATSVEVYACKTDNTAIGEILVTGSYTGASNTVQLTFDAEGTETFLIIELVGSDGQIADIDNVQVRDIPTLTQQTEFATVFNRETSVNSGSRQTVFNTTTAFVTSFNTQYATVFDLFPEFNTTYVTQALTSSQALTNRSTTVGTVTAFGTTYATARVTNHATGTSRTTSLSTNRATGTTFDTVFETAFITNRATTTNFSTAYDTVYATDRVTTTDYLTTFGTIAPTNRATETSFATNLLTAVTAITNRATNTVRATNRATTTAYATSAQTSRATTTSRTTTFNTTYVTTYNTTFNTTYQTSTFTATFSAGVQIGFTDVFFNTTRATARATTKSTVRSTSRVSSFATTTAYATAVAESRSTTTTFNTTFATTTTFNTTFNTTTVFLTDRSTTTAFNTTDQTTRETSRSSATTFNTDHLTNRATNRSTVTSFITAIATNLETTRSTSSVFNTQILTSFDTSTAYQTVFDTVLITNRVTSSVYDTAFLTGTTQITDIQTVRSTETTVPTAVTTVTNRTTALATNRATVTNRTTQLVTNIATSVVRQTSRTTVFVAFPTSFVTAYLTGTNVATDYQTAQATQRTTDTSFDTEYPTERLTSVLTQTDVAE